MTQATGELTPRAPDEKTKASRFATRTAWYFILIFYFRSKPKIWWIATRRGRKRSDLIYLCLAVSQVGFDSNTLGVCQQQSTSYYESKISTADLDHNVTLFSPHSRAVFSWFSVVMKLLDELFTACSLHYQTKLEIVRSYPWFRIRDHSEV